MAGTPRHHPAAPPTVAPPTGTGRRPTPARPRPRLANRAMHGPEADIDRRTRTVGYRSTDWTKVARRQYFSLARSGTCHRTDAVTSDRDRPRSHDTGIGHRRAPAAPTDDPITAHDTPWAMPTGCASIPDRPVRPADHGHATTPITDDDSGPNGTRRPHRSPGRHQTQHAVRTVRHRCTGPTSAGRRTRRVASPRTGPRS